MNARWPVLLALAVICTGCLGTWREYIVTTEDAALVTAPSPPMSAKAPPEAGGVAWSGQASIASATGWLGLPTTAHNVGHVVPIGQLGSHFAYRPAAPIEVGAGFALTSYRLSEPASATLDAAPLAGSLSAEAGPTVRVHMPLSERANLTLISETRLITARVYRTRTEVTVMEYEDGPMEGHRYVANRHRTQGTRSTTLARQLIGLGADVRLPEGRSLDGGVAMQSHPVFEESHQLRDACYGGSGCEPPASPTPKCHAAILTPWLGFTAPARGSLVRAGLFASLDLAPYDCSYPETIGLTLEFGGTAG